MHIFAPNGGYCLYSFSAVMYMMCTYIYLSIAPTVSREKCFLGNINNNDLKLTGSHGILQSPNEPKHYPAGSSCDWLITVPEGKIVKLIFDRFELDSSYGCTSDYVEVFDGSSSSSKSKGRFCDYSTPDDIYSSGRYMWVRFRADSSRSSHDGFKATFSAEDKRSKRKANNFVQ